MKTTPEPDSNERGANPSQEHLDALKALEIDKAAAIRREQLERDQRQAAENERDRLKLRSKNGCCPCCKRNFQNLQRHMRTKHPEFAVTPA